MTLYRECPMCAAGTCIHTTPCSGCLESEVIGMVPVTIDDNLIVESDVPDGQGYDWVIVQVPKAGRYAVVPVDAALGDNE